jgi:hypothetical protein
LKLSKRTALERVQHKLVDYGGVARVRHLAELHRYTQLMQQLFREANFDVVALHGANPENGGLASGV